MNDRTVRDPFAEHLGETPPAVGSGDQERTDTVTITPEIVDGQQKQDAKGRRFHPRSRKQKLKDRRQRKKKARADKASKIAEQQPDRPAGTLDQLLANKKRRADRLRLTQEMVLFKRPTEGLVIVSKDLEGEIRNVRQLSELPFFAAVQSPPQGDYVWREKPPNATTTEDAKTKPGRYLIITPAKKSSNTLRPANAGPEEAAEDNVDFTGRPTVKDEPVIMFAQSLISEQLRTTGEFSARIRLIPADYFRFIGIANARKNYLALIATIKRLAATMVDTNVFEGKTASFSGFVTNVQYHVPCGDKRERNAIEFDLCNWLIDLILALQSRVLDREYFTLPPLARKLYQLAEYHLPGNVVFKIGRTLLRAKIGQDATTEDPTTAKKLDQAFGAQLGRLERFLQARNKRGKGGHYWMCGVRLWHDEKFVYFAPADTTHAPPLSARPRS